MTLSSLSLKNFRIHTDTTINFSGNLNYIVGGNGYGKTSILESIYYLCTTKSCSTKSDLEAVSFGRDEFEVSGRFEVLTKDEVKVIYSIPESKKYYFRNSKLISKTSDIIGRFPVVLSTPLDHSITQGVPGERRKFIDSIISQASSTYLQILIDYNRTLRQRSSLLQSIKETKNYSLMGELDAWTEKLMQGGLEIIKHRVAFIKNFHLFVRNSYYKIMGEDEEPKITYYFLNDSSEDNIESRFKTLLDERHNEELRRATNLVGPHRDNFIFELNGLNLKTYGSQGQHKTFQAVLRFAEFCYLKEVTGRSPLFLLDDVFGELDANRASKISEYLGEVGQAFVTLTDFGNFSFLKTTSEDKVIKLNRGEVVNA